MNQAEPFLELVNGYYRGKIPGAKLKMPVVEAAQVQTESTHLMFITTLILSSRFHR